MGWVLEIVLVLMLAITIFHALRLERALGVLKRDRAALEALVSGFNRSAEDAAHSVERLHEAAEGVGRQIERQIAAGTRLQDDLQFLIERGDRLADRLEAPLRAHTPLNPAGMPPLTLVSAAPADPAPRPQSQAERDLLKALRLARA